MQFDGSRIEVRDEKVAPADHTAFRQVSIPGNRLWLGSVEQVRNHPKVAGSTDAFGQLRAEREHQGFGEPADVMSSGGFIKVEDRMPTQFDTRSMSLEDRGHGRTPAAGRR